MAKKGKKKEEKEIDIEDLAECPTCGEEISVEAAKCPSCGEDFREEEAPEEKTPKPVKMKKIDKKEKIKAEKEMDLPKGQVKYTLLIIGLLLSLMGVLGVIGLRLGFVQSLLGDASPYPGIGHVEPTGHIVSIIPFVIGLVTIFVWGIKNEPLYIEKGKVKEEEFDFEKEEESVEEEPQPVPEVTEEETPKVTETFGEKLKVGPQEPEVHEEVPEDIQAELDSLDEIVDGSEIKVADEIAEDPGLAALASSLEEDERINLCNDALAAADVYEQDRKDLMKLILLGMSITEFRDRIDEAEKKKRKAEEEKKKQFKKMSAEERGTSLEDELAAELAILEEELDEADEDDDIEEKILREIEDLEDL